MNALFGSKSAHHIASHCDVLFILMKIQDISTFRPLKGQNWDFDVFENDKSSMLGQTIKIYICSCNSNNKMKYHHININVKRVVAAGITELRTRNCLFQKWRNLRCVKYKELYFSQWKCVKRLLLPISKHRASLYIPNYFETQHFIKKISNIRVAWFWHLFWSTCIKTNTSDTPFIYTLYKILQDVLKMNLRSSWRYQKLGSFRNIPSLWSTVTRYPMRGHRVKSNTTLVLQNTHFDRVQGKPWPRCPFLCFSGCTLNHWKPVW